MVNKFNMNSEEKERTRSLFLEYYLASAKNLCAFYVFVCLIFPTQKKKHTQIHTLTRKHQETIEESKNDNI